MRVRFGYIRDRGIGDVFTKTETQNRKKRAKFGDIRDRGTGDVIATGDEAEKILNEAVTIAKQRTKDRFPDLPTTEKDIGPPSLESP